MEFDSNAEDAKSSSSSYESRYGPRYGSATAYSAYGPLGGSTPGEQGRVKPITFASIADGLAQLRQLPGYSQLVDALSTVVAPSSSAAPESAGAPPSSAAVDAVAPASAPPTSSPAVTSSGRTALHLPDPTARLAFAGAAAHMYGNKIERGHYNRENFTMQPICHTASFADPVHVDVAADPYAWLHAFQRGTAIEDGPRRRATLALVHHKFKTRAEEIAERLVNHDPTLTTNPLGGIAGGRKYVVDGILLKYCDDPQIAGFKAGEQPLWLYGGATPRTDLAQKAASNELRSCDAYFAFFHDHRIPITVPTQVLMDLAGERIVAMPLLPLQPKGKGLVYGSGDGGITVRNDHPVFRTAMACAAAQFRLAPHLVGGETLYSGGDVEGHVGADGKLYLLDFARVFPPECDVVPTEAKAAARAAEKATRIASYHVKGNEPFYRGIPSFKPQWLASELTAAPPQGCHVWYRLLRPEFLGGRAAELPPLSSDAFSAWGMEDGDGPNIDNLQASNQMITRNMVALAADLDAQATLDPTPAMVMLRRFISMYPELASHEDEMLEMMPNEPHAHTYLNSASTGENVWGVAAGAAEKVWLKRWTLSSTPKPSSVPCPEEFQHDYNHWDLKVDVSQVFHQHGVALRHLDVVRGLCRQGKVRQRLLAEMQDRAKKHVYRRALREYASRAAGKVSSEFPANSEFFLAPGTKFPLPTKGTQTADKPTLPLGVDVPIQDQDKVAPAIALPATLAVLIALLKQELTARDPFNLGHFCTFQRVYNEMLARWQITDVSDSVAIPPSIETSWQRALATMHSAKQASADEIISNNAHIMGYGRARAEQLCSAMGISATIILNASWAAGNTPVKLTPPTNEHDRVAARTKALTFLTWVDVESNLELAMAYAVNDGTAGVRGGVDGGVEDEAHETDRWEKCFDMILAAQAKLMVLRHALPAEAHVAELLLLCYRALALSGRSAGSGNETNNSNFRNEQAQLCFTLLRDVVHVAPPPPPAFQPGMEASTFLARAENQWPQGPEKDPLRLGSAAYAARARTAVHQSIAQAVAAGSAEPPPLGADRLTRALWGMGLRRVPPPVSPAFATSAAEEEKKSSSSGSGSSSEGTTTTTPASVATTTSSALNSNSFFGLHRFDALWQEDLLVLCAVHMAKFKSAYLLGRLLPLAVSHGGFDEGRTLVFAKTLCTLASQSSVLDRNLEDPAQSAVGAFQAATALNMPDLLDYLLEAYRFTAHLKTSFAGLLRSAPPAKALDLRLVDVLNKHGITDAVSQYNHPMVSAARGGQLNVLQYYIAKQPDILNEEVVREACAAGHMDVVECLLGESKAEPLFNHSTLTQAIARGRAKVVTLLVHRFPGLLTLPRVVGLGGGKAKEGNMPLEYACRIGHTDVVTALLDAKADVTAVSEGCQPLTTAAGRAPAAIVERLLEMKANVHATDTGGPAIVHACIDQNHDVIEVLVAHGADPTEYTDQTKRRTHPVMRSNRLFPDHRHTAAIQAAIDRGLAKRAAVPADTITPAT